jgi:hypothetical protein
MKTYKELKTKRVDLLHKVEKLKEARIIFEDRVIKVGDSVLPGIFWDMFHEYIEDLSSQQNQLWKEMDDLRKNCEHVWEDSGYDSHGSWEECIICGTHR